MIEKYLITTVITGKDNSILSYSQLMKLRIVAFNISERIYNTPRNVN
jgi:hypothetical protein